MAYYGTEGPDDLENDPDTTNDIIDALGGNDVITISHSDTEAPVATVRVNAGDGNDLVSVTNGTNLIVNVFGGNGYDTVVATGDAYVLGLTDQQIILIDDSSLISAIINYTEVERLVIYGTADTINNDRIYWTTGDTVDEITVFGTRGELPITILTGGGDDQVYLNDLVGNGSEVFAGSGNDYVQGSSRSDILDGGGGTDTLFGGDGNDTLNGGYDDDNLDGGDGNDTLVGGAGWDTLIGGAGDDNLDGSDGNDTLVGGAGWDTLTGGNGNDTLFGGGGRDILLGGAGSDTFRYDSVQESSGAGGIDTINFERGVDKIDLSRIGGLHWIGAAPFSGAGGELRGTMLGVQADINGDKVPDMIIWTGQPYGGLNMTAGDFIL